LRIIVRDDGTWCRIYAGEEACNGVRVVEVPDDCQTEDEIDTFVMNLEDI